MVNLDGKIEIGNATFSFNLKTLWQLANVSGKRTEKTKKIIAWTTWLHGITETRTLTWSETAIMWQGKPRPRVPHGIRR